MSGSKLKKPSLALIGYWFISLYNNMGIIYWFTVIFIFFLFVNWVIYMFIYKVDRLSANSKLVKCIHLAK